jgi:lipoate-protein ligase A
MEPAPSKRIADLALWEDPASRDGPGQMACDEVLVNLAEVPILRVFRWGSPWVSAGFFTAIEDAARARPDLPVCRRWTGGGIVVHEGDFTFSLILPRGERLAAERPGESYRLIHAALAEALREQGYAAALSGEAVGDSRECFVGAVKHDVVLDGKKIAGGAQRRTRRALLHQGSVQGAAKLSRAFGSVFAGALAASFGEWCPPPGLEERIAALTREKYANPAFLRNGRGSMVFTGAAAS